MANALKLSRNGAVGFIGWLDLSRQLRRAVCDIDLVFKEVHALAINPAPFGGTFVSLAESIAFFVSFSFSDHVTNGPADIEPAVVTKRIATVNKLAGIGVSCRAFGSARSTVPALVYFHDALFDFRERLFERRLPIEDVIPLVEDFLRLLAFIFVSHTLKI